MNAAAKGIYEPNLFSGHLSDMRISKYNFFLAILLFAVLVSAIAVVYVTNLHRLTFTKLQEVELQTHRLQLQWGQLLLEQSSIATPARVQQLAEEKLHMVLPTTKDIIILRAQ